MVKFKAEGRVGGLKVFWCLAMRHLKLKRTKFHLNKNFLYHLNKTVNKRGILFPFLSKYFILYVKCKLFLVFQEFKFKNHNGSKENNHFNIFLIFLGKLNPKLNVSHLNCNRKYSCAIFWAKLCIIISILYFCVFLLRGQG